MTVTTNTAANINDYRKAGGNVSSAANQRICGKLVEREIVCCLSMLVHHFVSHEDALKGSDYHYDDVLDLCRNSDWETAADAFIDDWDIDELAELAEYNQSAKAVDEDGELDWTDAQVADMRKIVKSIAEEDGHDNFCRKHDIDPEENEVYEHWAVSSHFAEKLAEQGETVGELFNLQIWGRCCTGQAISMDYVIQAVAASMEILEGQKYAWTE